jgi:hypothetical protein
MMFENRVEGTMPERHVSGRSGIVDTVLRVLRHCGEGSIIVRTCLPLLGGVARRKIGFHCSTWTVGSLFILRIPSYLTYPPVFEGFQRSPGDPRKGAPSAVFAGSRDREEH